MRNKIFLDTNIIISGIFFEGNESKIIESIEFDLLTCEDVIDELYYIVKKKLKYLTERTFEIALLEIEKALYDFTIIPKHKYLHKVEEAKTLIHHDKDIFILAAVLYSKPDFFITGDSHFFTSEIKQKIKVMNSKEFLSYYHI